MVLWCLRWNRMTNSNKYELAEMLLSEDLCNPICTPRIIFNVDGSGGWWRVNKFPKSLVYKYLPFTATSHQLETMRTLVALYNTNLPTYYTHNIQNKIRVTILAYKWNYSRKAVYSETSIEDCNCFIEFLKVFSKF